MNKYFNFLSTIFITYKKCTLNENKKENVSNFCETQINAI